MATHFRKKKVEVFHRPTLFEHTTQIYQNPMENENVRTRYEYTKILQWFVEIDVNINSMTNDEEEKKFLHFFIGVFLKRKMLTLFHYNLLYQKIL